MGRANLLPVIQPTSSQVATICYTSVCGQHSYFVTSCLMHALREPPDSRKVLNILVRQLPRYTEFDNRRCNYPRLSGTGSVRLPVSIHDGHRDSDDVIPPSCPHLRGLSPCIVLLRLETHLGPSRSASWSSSPSPWARKLGTRRVTP